MASIWAFLQRHIDFRMAWAGALFLALVVFGINYVEHGARASAPAALKQATYTFFVAGFVMRLAENLAVKIKRRTLALLTAVFIPGCIAIGLTYTLHSFMGTPEPLYSTIPTMLTAPLGFFWWGRRKRNQFEAEAATSEGAKH